MLPEVTDIHSSSCYRRSLTSIQAHSLPSACRAEFCKLCYQPEPSLSHYLPECRRLLRDTLSDCKLQGEPSTWVSGHSSNSCATSLNSHDREMHGSNNSTVKSLRAAPKDYSSFNFSIIKNVLHFSICHVIFAQTMLLFSVSFLFLLDVPCMENHGNLCLKKTSNPNEKRMIPVQRKYPEKTHGTPLKAHENTKENP